MKHPKGTLCAKYSCAEDAKETSLTGTQDLHRERLFEENGIQLGKGLIWENGGCYRNLMLY